MVAGQPVFLPREGEDGCCCGGDWARNPLLSTISQCTGRNPPSRGKTASQLLRTGSVETPLAPLGAAAPSSAGATPHSVLRTGPTVLGKCVVLDLQSGLLLPFGLGQAGAPRKEAGERQEWTIQRTQMDPQPPGKLPLDFARIPAPGESEQLAGSCSLTKGRCGRQ